MIQASGARLVPFAGWEMPLQFAGVVKEHQAVRSGCGLFDISHMGVLRLTGETCSDHLQRLVPSDLHRIGPGEACYTVLMQADGGILDDLIAYDCGLRDGQSELLLVINAACAEADTAWLQEQLAPHGVMITDAKGDGVLLALQGPQAAARLAPLLGESTAAAMAGPDGTPLAALPRFGHRQLRLEGIGEGPAAGAEVLVARTGYTGEDGFELLLPSGEAGTALWQRLTESGVEPCGLGARDTLRLEAGLHLYGSDMDRSTSPLEASLGWLVHLEMPEAFVGRDVLERQTAEGLERRLVGLSLEGRAIPRAGYSVRAGCGSDDAVVGRVTSGSWSPTLQCGIAMAYVPPALARPGTELAVEIRGTPQPARVVRRPFLRR
ncbi:glycine cleavage system aminomethyltransferase GcvT [Synechococcus sp. RSCCF101]|uniref:glycine cleavage system aminomethyltransferase GcvT n=1 Tax=Synechococcus sp. RSCCF101 TaxID=2511069 RepID=UPI00351A91BC